MTKLKQFKEDRKAVHIYEREVDPNLEDSLGKLVKWITPRSTVLDLGVATGYFGKYMKEELACTVDGVELSAEMAEKAKPNYRKLLIADLDETSLEEHFDKEAYDFVVAGDVIEHLKCPELALNACRKLIKPQGRILLSVPNITHVAVVGQLLKGKFTYTEEGLLDKTHLHFFTRESLHNLLVECGFQIDFWNNVTKLPEDTEVGTDFSDFPKTVQDALFATPDALTYQFIVAASRSSDLKQRDEGGRQDVSLSVEALRKSRNLQLRRGLEETQKALTEAQEIVHSRDQETVKLTEALTEAQSIVLDRNQEVDKLTAALTEAQGIVGAKNLEVGKLTAALTEAQEIVIVQNEKVEILTAALTEAQEIVIVRNEKVEILSAALTEAQEIVGVQNEKVEILSAALSEAQEIVGERSQEIEKLSDALTEAQAIVVERGNEIEKLTTALTEAQDIVRERVQEINELTEALSLTQAIVGERDQFIGKLTDDLAESQETVRLRGKAIAQLTQAVAEANTKLDARDEELHQIHQSRSWRYTKILRDITGPNKEEGSS